MSSTSPANRPPSTFDVSNLAPVVAPAPPQPVAVVKEPPKPNPLVEGWKSFKASPHGRALASWGQSVGVLAPIALTAGAGYAVGHIDPQGASTVIGPLLGGIAGAISIPFQVSARTGLVPTYKRMRHENPYWASLANVTCYMTAPAAAAGASVAVASGSGWGIGVSVIVGIIGALLGLTAQGYRLKDHPPRHDE